MDEKVRTLVVDDEEGIRFFVSETLRRDGYEVAAAASGEEALDLLRDSSYEIVILDLQLGGRTDGLRVLEAIRWRWPRTVVIILTGHGTLDSALTAIREGVDGYLLKPVEPQEVRRTAKEALERRLFMSRAAKENGDGDVLEVGPFRIDLDKHVITKDNISLDLTPQEWLLLVHMIENRQRVLSPEELVKVVREYDPEDLYEARQIIKWYVHRLRRKIEIDPSRPRYILNVRGVGYTFGG